MAARPLRDEVDIDVRGRFVVASHNMLIWAADPDQGIVCDFKAKTIILTSLQCNRGPPTPRYLVKMVHHKPFQSQCHKHTTTQTQAHTHTSTQAHKHNLSVTSTSTLSVTSTSTTWVSQAHKHTNTSTQEQPQCHKHTNTSTSTLSVTSTSTQTSTSTEAQAQQAHEPECHKHTLPFGKYLALLWLVRPCRHILNYGKQISKTLSEYSCSWKRHLQKEN